MKEKKPEKKPKKISFILNRHLSCQDFFLIDHQIRKTVLGIKLCLLKKTKIPPKMKILDKKTRCPRLLECCERHILNFQKE